jgi:hypothetical protein
MNKYAAGGKCGTMSGCDKVAGSQGKEVNSNLSALMAERNKLDSMFSSVASPVTEERKHQLPNCYAVTPAAAEQHKQTTTKKQESAIVLSKVSNKKETRASDIDFILGGDF